MKALVYTGTSQLEYRSEPDPIPESGEALIRVQASGICGSDMHAYFGHDERRIAPLILGHEVSGEVISGSQPGSRVVVNPLVTCGACSYCTSDRENLCQQRQIISMQPRQGAFSELLRMPERNLVGHQNGRFEARTAGLLDIVGGCFRRQAATQRGFPGQVKIPGVFDNRASNDLSKALPLEPEAINQSSQRTGQ